MTVRNNLFRNVLLRSLEQQNFDLKISKHSFAQDKKTRHAVWMNFTRVRIESFSSEIQLVLMLTEISTFLVVLFFTVVWSQSKLIVRDDAQKD